MSSKSSVLMSGVIAAVIAIVLIGGVVAAGILNTRTTGSTESETAPTGSGTLAVLLTDPPTVPNGTTHVYITYSNLAIHISGAANNTGWHDLNAQGNIDLMSIINVSQTIASAKIQNGVFNALEFNITSATVTFDGANYSAYLVYQDHTLFVPIVGGISIINGQTSAAVIDLTPTVLLLGDPSNPTFAFIPAARGYTMPAQSIPQLHVGDITDVHNESWYRNNQPRFEITGAVLTPTKLSITVTNVGNVSLDFRLAAVTSTISAQGGFRSTLPGISSVSEFFVVYPNDSLAPITTNNDRTIAQMISSGGYRLPPAASVTFTYTGQITIGIVHGRINQPLQQIIPGDRYLISITSSDRLAQTSVVADGTSIVTNSTTTTSSNTNH